MNAKKTVKKHMTTLTDLQGEMTPEVYIKVYELIQKSWHDMILLGMYHRERISDKLWKSIQKSMYKDDGYDRSQDMGDN
jgi:hypothetical protein